jgi:hypothetical protein
MSTNSKELRCVFVEVQVQGEGASQSAHEWGSVQMWDEGDLVALLQMRLGKTDDEVRSLLKSHDDDHSNREMTIAPYSSNFPVVEEAYLADSR